MESRAKLQNRAVQAAAFKHYVILLNPASTHAELGQRRTTELIKRYGAKQVTVLKTTGEKGTSVAELLAKHASLLGSSTLLCIAAGDGTVNSVIGVLVQDDLPSRARQTPVLPLWGGNANDLAHMLNGTASTTPLDEIISQGRVVMIHPLACQLTYADGAAETHIAACYASFGATAFAASRLNEQDHRSNALHRVPGGRFFSELRTSLKALLDAPVFRIDEGGKRFAIYERTFSIGSRFAKVDNLPVSLTDRRIYQHTIASKRLLAVLSRVTGLQKAPPASENPAHSTFTTHEETIAQFDGEPMDIPAHTQISIALAGQPFYAFSTLLHDAPQSAHKPQ